MPREIASIVRKGDDTVLGEGDGIIADVGGDRIFATSVGNNTERHYFQASSKC